MKSDLAEPQAHKAGDVPGVYGKTMAMCLMYLSDACVDCHTKRLLAIDGTRLQ